MFSTVAYQLFRWDLLDGYLDWSRVWVHQSEEHGQLIGRRFAIAAPRSGSFPLVSKNH